MKKKHFYRICIMLALAPGLRFLKQYYFDLVGMVPCVQGPHGDCIGHREMFNLIYFTVFLVFLCAEFIFLFTE